jgi:hypothetical protein
MLHNDMHDRTIHPGCIKGALSRITTTRPAAEFAAPVFV